MPKVLFKFKQKKRNYFTIFFVFFLTLAQSQNKMVIAYGQSINLGNVPQDTRFEIQGPKSKRLKGKKINQYRFEKPGLYKIEIQESQNHATDCSHLHLPKEVWVEVSRVRMTFSQPIEFSSPIVKNKDTHDIILKVPVAIQTYDHLPAPLNRNPVASAGIGSGIMAQLKTETSTLNEGKHFLEYALSGTATENAYLMFDFVDSNGKIQSVSVVTPVIN